ncbi:MAG: amino acid ABC transporter permease [Clostridia bacterium]|nr:amino acid ABC transporter permease [Clostridia bacterium]
MKEFFLGVWEDFYSCFLENGSYMMYLKGLRNTIIMAILACIVGLIIGIVVTIIRVVPKKNKALVVLDKIANLYVTIIRGTPVVLQLFIGYFVIFAAVKTASFIGIKETAGIPVAAVVFGINSGAYMSEILRGGINAVDFGQMEAGRSLGLSWLQTFMRVVLPQSLKSAIPTMFNEFITLVKETSVAGYVGIVDLMKIQKYVTTQNAELYMPLLIIAAIYLIIVLGLQQIQKLIERRLMASDKR